jgi:hypothetical protein
MEINENFLTPYRQRTYDSRINFIVSNYRKKPVVYRSRIIVEHGCEIQNTHGWEWKLIADTSAERKVSSEPSPLGERNRNLF